MGYIKLKNTTILITGAVGFIGANLAERICKAVENVTVIGVDNINDYYDVHLKEYRLKRLKQCPAFIFKKGNIADKSFISQVFSVYQPQIVVNLAAQAGVRYSIVNPDAYIESNLIGFYNILEACRHSYDNGKTGVEHLVYASSSSVYGSNQKIPYSTDDQVDHPVSLYAATKKSNELMAYAYSKLYHIPCTGLRFFTVYGPAGRPDMAYFSFTKKFCEGETIQIFNYGNCMRDFTYIDDIVEGVVRVMQKSPEQLMNSDGSSVPPYKIYNIGNNHPENLLTFVTILQEELIKAGVLCENYDFEAHKRLVPMQPGDVAVTYADIHDELRKLFAKSADAKRLGYKAGDFSYNTGKLRCLNCDGTGTIALDVQFLPDVNIECPTCRGTRYAKEISFVKIKNSKDKEFSLADLMAMDVAHAYEYCKEYKLIAQRLKVLMDLGLGYLTLGEETPSLSGGEAQRLKLASEMGKGQSDSVFVFDEPTIGLHPLDIKVLMQVFNSLIEKGATVIVIEHDLDVIRSADYIIDMGPGGGTEGGRIVACGTPYKVKHNPCSITGRFI